MPTSTAIEKIIVKVVEFFIFILCFRSFDFKKNNLSEQHYSFIFIKFQIMHPETKNVTEKLNKKIIS